MSHERLEMPDKEGHQLPLAEKNTTLFPGRRRNVACSCLTLKDMQIDHCKRDPSGHIRVCGGIGSSFSNSYRCIHSALGPPKVRGQL